MSEDPTKDLPNRHSFEEKVLAHLAAIDQRLQTLEAKKYDTKPIWERALKEIADTRLEIVALRQEMNHRFDDLDERMDVLAGDVIKVRARIKHPTVPEASLEDEPEKRRA